MLLAIAAAVGLAGPGRYALDAVYGIVLPASSDAIYLIGLVLEVVALAAIQVARTRRAIAQTTTTQVLRRPRGVTLGGSSGPAEGGWCAAPAAHAASLARL